MSLHFYTSVKEEKASNKNACVGCVEPTSVGATRCQYQGVGYTIRPRTLLPQDHTPTGIIPPVRNMGPDRKRHHIPM